MRTTSRGLTLIVLLACAVGLPAPSSNAGEDDKAPTSVESREASDPGGILGSTSYKPSEREKPFFEKVPKEERITGSMFQDYSITGKVGTYVGWFGIVREVVEDRGKGETRFLVEQKYFDGLTDLHMQVVSFTGGGDFRARMEGTGLGIRHMSLVRLYGNVIGEEESVPRLDAQYAVHFDWGAFGFMNYGKPKGNQKWREACTVPIDGIYSSRPNAAYYEARLGPRETAPTIVEAEEAKGVETIEVLGRAAFDALVKDDLALLDPALPTVADIVWLVGHLEEREGEGKKLDPRGKMEEQGGAQAMAAESREKMAKTFHTARERAGADFDWEAAEYGGVLVGQKDEMKGVETCEPILVVRVGQKAYEFEIRGVGRMKRGWVATKGVRYRGEVK